MWKKNTMLPFKVANPFFCACEKTPLSSVFLLLSLSLLPHLVCQERLRLFSQLGGWKTDRGQTGRQETREQTDRVISRWNSGHILSFFKYVFMI